MIAPLGMSPRAAAALLGVDPETVRRWCLAGRIEHIRIRHGRTQRLFIKPEALEAFAAASRVPVRRPELT